MTGEKYHKALIRLKIGAALLIAMLACLFGGMFFTDTEPSLWLISTSLTLGALLVAIATTIRSTNDSLVDTMIGMKYIVAGPFIISGMYVCHLFIGDSLSTHATVLSALCWMFYGVFGLLLYAQVSDRTSNGRLCKGWSLIIGCIALSAIAVIYGLIPLSHGILRSSDPAVTSSGARLGGFLQYPNFFGAIMGAALIERLMALTLIKKETRMKLYFTGAIALIYMVSLILSESRGAYAATIVGWAAGYLLLPTEQRQRYLLQTGVYAAAGALLSRQLAAAQLAPPLLPGLLWLAAVLAAALTLSGLVARAAAPRRAALVCGSATLLIAGGALYGAGVHVRLWRLDTLSARLHMYADALRLFTASPWMGQGGDTWRNAYRRIQSGPYVGSEVHSGLIDITLDIGVIGVTILLFWLGTILIMLFKAKSRMLPPCIIFLVHSIFDFDMSYGLFWLLLIWMIAIGRSEHRIANNEPRVANYKMLFSLRVYPMIYCLLATLLIIGSVTGFRLSQSLRMYDKASSVLVNDPVKGEFLLQRSLTLNPTRLDSRMELAHLLPLEQAKELLDAGATYHKNNAQLELTKGSFLASQGNVEALEVLRRAIHLDRFNRILQTEVLDLTSLLSSRLRDMGNEEQSRLVALEGYRMYSDYVKLTEEVHSSGWIRNDRGFKVTIEAAIRGRELGLVANQ